MGAEFELLGQISSVTGSRCVARLRVLDVHAHGREAHGAQMGALLAIEVRAGVVLAVVLGLAMQGPEVGWTAELGLVGEIKRRNAHARGTFSRGVVSYPRLGDKLRSATSDELSLAFGSSGQATVRIGSVLQNSALAAAVGVDDLLGKHFAVLGTTGTGKSCTTALILRALLTENPAAHIVLLDPHNEYAAAFGDCAEVVNQQNVQLPYWLLTFEELVEVVLGDRPDRRQETEILQDLIPLAKARYGRGAAPHALRRATDLKYSVDSPVPYRMSELIGMLDERMGRLENKRDISPYRNLKIRLESISSDPRYAFMFGSLTVADSMAEILGRLFRVPNNGRPMTIVELAGLPGEVTSVVVSLLCRLTFDFALWCEGKLPVTIVCEEAHRYVPADAGSGFLPCRRAIARIAKEGRKYGASLCIVTQRPAEIDATILSQCSTVIAHRLSNDRDQELVRTAISETGAGLLEFLPTLGPREAIAFGEAVCLPMRLSIDTLPEGQRPRSASIPFSKLWQVCKGDRTLLDDVVERWRSATLRGPSFDLPAAGLEAAEASEAALSAPAREPLIERREFGASRGEGSRQGGRATGYEPDPAVRPPQSRPSLRRRSSDL